MNAGAEVYGAATKTEQARIVGMRSTPYQGLPEL